jgi:TPR repeat protein
VSSAADGKNDVGPLEERQTYLNEDGVPQDCAQSRNLLNAAASHGNARTKSLLGTMYASGECVGKDLPTAYRWYAKALQLEPGNQRVSRDLEIVWNQMTIGERRAAVQRTR